MGDPRDRPVPGALPPAGGRRADPGRGGDLHMGAIGGRCAGPAGRLLRRPPRHPHAQGPSFLACFR